MSRVRKQENVCLSVFVHVRESVCVFVYLMKLYLAQVFDMRIKQRRRGMMEEALFAEDAPVQRRAGGVR